MHCFCDLTKHAVRQKTITVFTLDLGVLPAADGNVNDTQCMKHTLSVQLLSARKVKNATDPAVQ